MTKLTAEQIAEMADQGKDVSQYFTKSGLSPKDIISAKAQKPLRRSIDFGPEMYEEFEAISRKLNISVSAVIKMALQDYLIKYRNVYADTQTAAGKKK